MQSATERIKNHSFSAGGVPNCTGSVACFSRFSVLTRPKLRLRSAQPLQLQKSRSRFHSRNVQKQPMRNTIAKKQAGQEDTDSDYLFGDCSQRAISRFGCGKSSVIKQTLEMQSEDISPTSLIGVKLSGSWDAETRKTVDWDGLRKMQGEDASPTIHCEDNPERLASIAFFGTRGPRCGD
jgi:hypothetical protein